MQFLAIEIYKSKNKLNQSVSCEKHIRKKIFHIHLEGVFLSLNSKLNFFMMKAVIIQKPWTGFYIITTSAMKELNTQKYGIKSLTFRGSILWNSLVPIKLKNVNFCKNFALTSYC